MRDAGVILLVIAVTGLIVTAQASYNTLIIARAIHRLEKKLDALAERVKEERK
jgi:hypothetical protein